MDNYKFVIGNFGSNKFYTSDNFDYKNNKNDIIDIINFTYCHIISLSLVNKNYSLFGDVMNYSLTISKLTENKIGYKDYNPVYSNAELYLESSIFDIGLENFQFKIEKNEGDLLTTTTFNGQNKLVRDEYILTIIALIRHSFFILDSYSWEGSNTTSDLLVSERFPLYKKSVEMLSDLSFRLLTCARVIQKSDALKIFEKIRLNYTDLP